MLNITAPAQVPKKPHWAILRFRANSATYDTFETEAEFFEAMKGAGEMSIGIKVVEAYVIETVTTLSQHFKEGRQVPPGAPPR